MEWKPISEAPKDGSFIDSYNANNGNRMVSRYNENHPGIETRWEHWDGQWGNKPTHFMPLPTPPTNEEK